MLFYCLPHYSAHTHPQKRLFYSQALLRLFNHTNTQSQSLKWTRLSEITCWISNKGHFNVFKARPISWISLKRMKVKSWTVYGFDNQIISVIKTEKGALESHLHDDKKQHLFWGFFSIDIRHQKEKRENAYYKNNSSLLAPLCIRIIYQMENIRKSQF